MPIHPALADAIAAARSAPSLHGAPSWRWHVDDSRLDLFEDRDRARRVDATDARLAVLSCGAALHHAVAELAAGGWPTTVSRLPAGRQPDHLARVHLDHRIPNQRAVRRTGFPPPPTNGFGAGRLSMLTSVVESHGTHLHLLARLALPHLAGAGRLAVLYGMQERRVDWLRAGEALAAVRITAAGHGLSVHPLPGTGETAAAGLVQRRFPGPCYFYLLLRFGAEERTAGPQRTGNL